MHKFAHHIVVLEASRIVSEGIQSVLFQSEIDCRVSRLETLDELVAFLDAKPVDILIANPMQFVNREKEIKKIRKIHPMLSIVGVDFGIVQKQSLHLFDASFTLYDSAEHIVGALLKLDKKKNDSSASPKNEDETLTDRETEVLAGLVNGQSNKEIADSLSISIHTVVSHRKNIALKTGIRSQSGLTIYAISKKIISIEDIQI